MAVNEYPYEECETCQNLGDCKHPEVMADNMGTPLPPDNCPRPIDIMRATVKKTKPKHKRYERYQDGD